MPCQPFIIWRPVPDKSRFQATAKGDDNVFDAQVTVESSSGLSKTIPLPAEVPINSGDHAAFDVLLNITSKPPADKPVILDLRIVDKNNKVVQVSDGLGGTRPAQCASQFTDATGNNPVGIVVVAVAEKN